MENNNTEEIREGNKLIAEFMGLEFENYVNTVGNYGVNILGCQYHCSWDWLMPVLEKIEQQKYSDNDGTDREYNFPFLRTFQGTMVRINRMGLHVSETRIKSAWLAVVEFIKWYNQQKLK